MPLLVGVLVIGLLVGLTAANPPDADVFLPIVLFFLLGGFTLTFGVPLPEGVVSMQPMVTVAACLVIGPVAAGWTAFLGAIAHGFVRARWGNRLRMPLPPTRIGIANLTLANVMMHTLSVLAGGALYQLAGGVYPLESLAVEFYVPIFVLGLSYLIVNYTLATCVICMRGRRALRRYWKAVPSMLVFDGAPLAFAPLVALVYARLGVGPFLILFLSLALTSLSLRDLATATRRLERRVQELDSLHAIGQALSASFDLNVILSKIHQHVAGLIPADSFYVALYDAETDRISFPLVIEEGQRVWGSSRQMGNGLTEHVLRTNAPLLIPRDVTEHAGRLGIEEIGRNALSWLGVPITVEGTALGIIAVQSYTTPDVYDASHEEMLLTLASHAAVAIQNARLYAQTDDALAHRVQELNSILKTVREGILLLDTDRRVLAVNRQLAEFLKIAPSEVTDRDWSAPLHADGDSLVSRVDYSWDTFDADCDELRQGDAPFKRQAIVIPGAPEQHVERTLVPVRDQECVIAGWLVTLRDLTEERELRLLRNELTDMLIHDLRSPLALVQGGLDMIGIGLSEDDMETVERAVLLARKSSDKMLRMIDDLLDISRLESGQMPLHLEKVSALSLLQDVASRFDLLTASRDVVFDIFVEPDLPPLHVDLKITVRVLENLLYNAFKFTPDGGRIELWVRRDPERAPGALVIGVTDTGPGIPSEATSRLFKKFEQVAPKDERQGTSLGLPFCKLAVEAHGGEIWVESELGKGSVFAISLPTVDS
jgi:signal transduction histidine kinase